MTLYLWAADEIEFPGETGLTRCFTIIKKSNHYHWNTNTSAFASSVVKEYRGINLTENTGKGLYLGTFPDVNTPAGDYLIFCYDSNSTLFNPNTTYSDGYILSWTGSAEYNPAVDANTAAIYSKRADANTTLVLADTSAVDTNGEARIRLTGSDTPLATVANQTIIIEDTNELQQTLAGLVSDINAIKDQVNDPNDSATIAGRIADLWLSNSGGFP